MGGYSANINSWKDKWQWPTSHGGRDNHTLQLALAWRPAAVFFTFHLRLAFVEISAGEAAWTDSGWGGGTPHRANDETKILSAK